MHARGQRPQAACTLTAASASGCRVCCTHQRELNHGNAEVTRHWAASFQLVEKGIESFPFGRRLIHNHVLPQTNGGILDFIVSLCSTLYMNKGAYLGYTAQR